MALASEDIGFNDLGKWDKKLIREKEFRKGRIFVEILGKKIAVFEERFFVTNISKKGIESPRGKDIFLGNNKVKCFFEWIIRPENGGSFFDGKFSELRNNECLDEEIKNLVV